MEDGVGWFDEKFEGERDLVNGQKRDFTKLGSANSTIGSTE